MNRSGSCLLLVLLATLGSCRDTSGCRPTEPTICAANRATASLVAGPWRTFAAPSALSLDMQLAANGTTLVGTGSFVSGGVAERADIQGFVFWRDAFFTPGGAAPAQSVVVLHLTFAGGRSARLDQATVRGDTLEGVLTLSADSTTSYGFMLVRDLAR